MKRFVAAVRDTEKALGASRKTLTSVEAPIEAYRPAGHLRPRAAQGGGDDQYPEYHRPPPCRPLAADRLEAILGASCSATSPPALLQLSDFEPE